MLRESGTRIPFTAFPCIALVLFLSISKCSSQDYDTPDTPPVQPKEIQRCNGVFMSYNFQGREKAYPIVRNVSAQAWTFQSQATIMNTGADEVKAWQMHIGFRYHELLVSVEGAVVVDGGDYPIQVGKNGTVLAGYPMTDLNTAIDTASDMTQMQVEVNIKGTQFGLGQKVNPMPRNIKLVNEGYICPAATRKGTYMHVCCRKDPKFKVKKTKPTRFSPRRYGDLAFTYDIMKAYDNRYTAQVTIDNNHPLGSLNQWNLTWEWMRNEFINDMRGAYTREKNPSECIYGAQGQYYKDFDFSTVMSCSKHPVIADLPAERENDDKVGRLPYCCKNGTLLPKTMNETKARAIFQMEVFKLPPDMNRTAFNPPQNWRITGRLSPTYKCGPPVRVEPTEFPDPSGIGATTSAIASWYVPCNMTRPRPRESKCCVSYSAYYSDSAIPCNTCACGCDEDARCDANAAALSLPTSSLLVPFANRTAQARAWANMKHKHLPRRLPCPDNCGVSVNWHIDSDYKDGWTARVTLFNWENNAYADWYTAVVLKKAFPGFEKAYSFNGTSLPDQKAIFMQGLQGLNYLVGEVNGTNPARDAPVPGKQQTVVSFKKKNIHGLDIVNGDGFPTRLYFNGEECSLPTELPKRSSSHRSSSSLLSAVSFTVVTFMILTFHLH